MGKLYATDTLLQSLIKSLRKMDWKLLTKDTIKSILRTHHECVNKFEGSRSQFSVEVLPFFIYY